MESLVSSGASAPSSQKRGCNDRAKDAGTMQVWGSLCAAASPMLSSLAQPHCANGPAHTRACGVLYRIIKVRAVLYTARTRRMHLKEEGREGKEKREGRKLPFTKCNEVEEGRTNKVQSMRAPGHTSLTEGISNG